MKEKLGGDVSCTTILLIKQFTLWSERIHLGKTLHKFYQQKIS